MLEEKIFPQLQSGFSDDNAYIRELTLKATLSIAPKLKQATLTGGALVLGEGGPGRALAVVWARGGGE